MNLPARNRIPGVMLSVCCGRCVARGVFNFPITNKL